MIKRVLFKIVSMAKRQRSAVALIGGLLLYCLVTYILRLSCPIKWILGISCPGCGMTRSLLSLLNLDIDRAIYYHPLIFAVIGIPPFIIVCKLYKLNRLRRVCSITVVVLFIMVYLFRLLILKSPVLECNPEQGYLAEMFRKIAKLLQMIA